MVVGFGAPKPFVSMRVWEFASRKFHKFDFQICIFWCILTAHDRMYLEGGRVTQKFLIGLAQIPRATLEAILAAEALLVESHVNCTR